MCNVRAVNSAFVSSFFISSFGANSFEGVTFNSDLRLSQSYYIYIYTKCRISTHRFSAFFFMEFPIPPLDGFCFWRPWMQHGSCFNRYSCRVHHCDSLLCLWTAAYTLSGHFCLLPHPWLLESLCLWVATPHHLSFNSLIHTFSQDTRFAPGMLQWQKESEELSAQ